MWTLTNSKKITFIIILFLINSTFIFGQRFYVVRHAEKSAIPKNDPELTDLGKNRAENLKNILKNKNIGQIFSTQTVRTINTAKPLALDQKIEIQIYDANNQSEFIENLKKNKDTNTLIVGHSNTIRYIINGLSEKEVLTKDLEDHEYYFLFEIYRRKLRKPKTKIIRY
jgi:2,3-bisphosphoglycerate-dependent phosphoglycerate mutase